MVPVIIFYLHIIGITAVFTNEYQKEGLSSAFLSIGFVVLIFSVGWSISTFILKYTMSEAGLGIWLNRDAVSLLFLSIAEAIFYSRYYKDEKKQTLNAGK